MNEIVSKILLAENKFMSKMHFKQPGFIYIAENRKYEQGASVKDKKGITITNAIQKILDESGRKPKKM